MRFSLVLLMLMLAGCAPTTLQGVRADASDRLTFTVAQNYQEVYRRISGPMRSCFQSGGMLGPSVVVQADLFSESRKAEIAVAIIGVAGTMYPFVVDVTALSEKATRVVASNWAKGWAVAGAKVQRWAVDGTSACDPDF